MTMNVHPIPALHDNYIWSLTTDDKHCVVVDPGEAYPVLQYLEQHGLTLEAILITHHHFDHVDGIAEILESHPCKVYGPDDKRIPVKYQVVDAQSVIGWSGPDITVLETPGHTCSHVSFLADAHLFCGDTLFALGCGKIFDGKAEDFYRSLQKITKLPEQTQVCCTHEYTLSNASFALQVEPDNKDLLAIVSFYKQQREEGVPTLPTELKSQFKTNPFLRTDTDVVTAKLEQMGFAVDTAVQRFASLRSWKDRF